MVGVLSPLKASEARDAVLVAVLDSFGASLPDSTLVTIRALLGDAIVAPVNDAVRDAALGAQSAAQARADADHAVAPAELVRVADAAFRSGIEQALTKHVPDVVRAVCRKADVEAPSGVSMSIAMGAAGSGVAEAGAPEMADLVVGTITPPVPTGTPPMSTAPTSRPSTTPTPSPTSVPVPTTTEQPVPLPTTTELVPAPTVTEPAPTTTEPVTETTTPEPGTTPSESGPGTTPTGTGPGTTPTGTGPGTTPTGTGPGITPTGTGPGTTPTGTGTTTTETVPPTSPAPPSPSAPPVPPVDPVDAALVRPPDEVAAGS